MTLSAAGLLIAVFTPDSDQWTAKIADVPLSASAVRWGLSMAIGYNLIAYIIVVLDEFLNLEASPWQKEAWEEALRFGEDVERELTALLYPAVTQFISLQYLERPPAREAFATAYEVFKHKLMNWLREQIYLVSIGRPLSISTSPPDDFKKLVRIWLARYGPGETTDQMEQMWREAVLPLASSVEAARRLPNIRSWWASHLQNFRIAVIDISAPIMLAVAALSTMNGLIAPERIVQ